MMRVLLWDISALGVVMGAFAAKQLLVLAAVFSLHGTVVTDEAARGAVSGIVMVARRREDNGRQELSLPGLVAKD